MPDDSLRARGALMNLSGLALVQALRSPAFAARIESLDLDAVGRIRSADDNLYFFMGAAAACGAMAPATLIAQLAIGTPSAPPVPAAALATALACAAAALGSYRALSRDVRAAFPDGVDVGGDGMPAEDGERPPEAGPSERRLIERSFAMARLARACRDASRPVLCTSALFLAVDLFTPASAVAGLLAGSLAGGILIVAAGLLHRAGARGVAGITG